MNNKQSLVSFDVAAFWQNEPRVVLAPMEGVIDSRMRNVLTQAPFGGVDLCVTEFIRVTDRLLPAHLFYRDCPELLQGCRTTSGVPVAVQLLGGKPQPLAENAAQAAELGALAIDLNFGCPAKTVNRHDGGATLLKDPERIFSIVSSVRASLPKEIPVSAKVRLGFSDKSRHREIAQAAAGGGASWLTVHARTRDEGYRPPAHWEFISVMRDSIAVPVIANGEIWTTADASRAREVSGTPHLMLGRGMLANPFLACDVQRELRYSLPLADSHGSSQTSERWALVCAKLILFSQLNHQDRGESYAVCRLKQWLKSLAKTFAEAHQAFENLKRFDSLQAILYGLSQPCDNHVYGQSDYLHQRPLPVLFAREKPA